MEELLKRIMLAGYAVSMEYDGIYDWYLITAKNKNVTFEYRGVSIEPILNMLWFTDIVPESKRIYSTTK